MVPTVAGRADHPFTKNQVFHLILDALPSESLTTRHVWCCSMLFVILVRCHPAMWSHITTPTSLCLQLVCLSVPFMGACGEGCHGKAKGCFSQPSTIRSLLSIISSIFLHCASGDYHSLFCTAWVRKMPLPQVVTAKMQGATQLAVVSVAEEHWAKMTRFHE